MTIVANFTADVESGASPLTVAFTDTRTGSPTHWFWDFGDGFYSTDQNPSHIYTEDGDYTVSLLTFDNTSSSTINGFRSNNLTKKGSGSDTSESGAWNGYLAETFRDRGNTTAESFLGLGGTGKFLYLSTKHDIAIDLTSLTPNANNSAILTIRFVGNPVHFHGGGMLVNNGSISFTAKDPIVTAGGAANVQVLDVSSDIGNNINYTTDDINGFTTRWGITLGIPPANKQSGYRTNPPFVTHYVNNSKDTEIKINFIGVGVDPPIAAFSGTPRKKLDSLTSQCTDESTNAPTSWSWKRRPSGIKANYVEFSTNENPSEDFDITDPTP